MKIRSRVYHKRGLLIHKHRNTLNKIKEFAISKIANLKKQLVKFDHICKIQLCYNMILAFIKMYIYNRIKLRRKGIIGSKNM